MTKALSKLAARTSLLARTTGRAIEKFAIKNDAKITLVLAISGVALTVYTTAKAAPKAAKIIAEAKEAEDRKAATKEATKQLIPVVTPVILSAGGTIGCIIGLHRMHIRKEAALSAAYAFSESARRELAEHLEDAAIEGETAQKRIDACTNDTVYETGLGNELCFDEWLGRYFRCSQEAIREACIDLNELAQSNQDMSASMNDFYYSLHLPPARIGEDFGFNLSTGHKMTVTFAPALKDHKIPCMAVSYHPELLY